MSPIRKNPILALFKSLVINGLENFGKYYSIYRGFVANRNDPENLQRLKLIIPQVGGNSIYDYWAYPRNVYYGENYGSQVIPQTGDVVWVEFEGGEPELPVWSLGHPARKELFRGDSELGDKDCYWFRTPNGNTIKINDTKNIITIKQANGQFIKINDKSISLYSDLAISLGKEDQSDFHAVLGEKNKEALEDIEQIIKKLHQGMVQDIAIFTARGFVNLVPKILEVQPLVDTLQGKIDQILSEKVTLIK